jgi:predicted MFS family arabinose efflux permease
VSRESARIYIAGFAAGTIGTLIGRLLGWEGTSLFVVGMGPVWLVMLIFMLRERRHEAELEHRMKPAAQRRT